MTPNDAVEHALHARFNEDVPVDSQLPGLAMLASMTARGSCRSFLAKDVSDELIRMLCAVALSSPSKSDLQQRDIIVITDPGIKTKLVQMLAGQPWIQSAPHLLVFCGNNRRQRQLHQWRNLPFVNDHLDAFFNAAVDSGIALSAFVTAAEAVGLGCCPISAIRNEAAKVSELLDLPDYVFPTAGLALGYPAAAQPTVSPRLPLSATVHKNRFDETNIEQTVASYDLSRHMVQPYKSQRRANALGTKDNYGWSDDKARQYSVPERADFGKFVLSQGFVLK